MQADQALRQTFNKNKQQQQQQKNQLHIALILRPR